MKFARYITEIAERLTPTNRPKGFAEFLVALLGELAKGRPISRTTLARTLGWPAEQVAAVLEQAPVPNTTTMGTSSAMSSPCARRRMSWKLTTAGCMPGARWTP